MSGRTFTIFMVALTVVGLLLYGQLANGTANVALGEAAPSTDLPLLRSDDPAIAKSPAASLADFKGGWVLVNFWASWCEPCRAESPALETYSKRHAKNNFQVLGVNTEDLTDDALAFLDEFDISYTNLRDGPGEYKDQFGLVGFPESFLIDPNGTVQAIRRGPVDLEYLEANITPFLTDPQ